MLSRDRARRTYAAAAAILQILAWASASMVSPVPEPVTQPCEHAEGPVWDTQSKVLLYVDIAGQMLLRYDPGLSKENVKGLHFNNSVSLVIPLQGLSNTYAVGVGRDLVKIRVNWDEVGAYTSASAYSLLASVQADKPSNRFNDGKADCKGRIWAGTMGPEPTVGVVTPEQGAFFRIAPAPGKPEYDVTPVLQSVSISNGLAWSAPGAGGVQLYYIDTPTRRIDAFDFNEETGTLGNRRVVFDFAASNVSGNPDGMTIDSEGNLWVACFDGWQVVQVDPRSGQVLRHVSIPAQRVTSVAFGGPGPNPSTLYVTTMRKGLTEAQLQAQPQAGAVFAVRGLGARGYLEREQCAPACAGGGAAAMLLIAGAVAALSIA